MAGMEETPDFIKKTDELLRQVIPPPGEGFCDLSLTNERLEKLRGLRIPLSDELSQETKDRIWGNLQEQIAAEEDDWSHRALGPY